MDAAPAPGSPSRGGGRDAFGALRLVLASLVIVSHTPELVDGDQHREWLFRLTGTITDGQLAVAGFFLISGYLIAGSLAADARFTRYIARRMARLYPGFIAASLVCLLVVAPLAGAAAPADPRGAAMAALVRMVTLARPMAQHPFPGLPFGNDSSGLDGPLWTIQYEFGCYLLLAAIAARGLLRPRALVPLAAALLLVGTVLPTWMYAGLSQEQMFGGPPDALFTLGGLFLAGAAWQRQRDRLRFPRPAIAAAAAGLAASLCCAPVVHLGLALFGGYLVLAAAAAAAGTPLARIGARTDLSYGVYLYAWPIEQLLIRYGGGDDLVRLGLATWALALACGWLSWTLIEKPVLDAVRRHGAQLGRAERLRPIGAR